MARPRSSKYNWQNPQTFLYEDNYGYGMNFYQPMIDYIDEKSKGKPSRSPHLPWTNERGLNRYSSRNLVQSYSETDLTRISRATETRAKKYLQDFKATAQSSFQLSKAVSASTITEKVKIEKTKKKKRELVRQVKVLKSKMADALDYNPELDKQVERELRGMQKHLRGKSAQAISDQLLSKSRRNIAENIEADVANLQRSFCGKTRVRIIDKRITESLDDNICGLTQPLTQLSSDLKGFHRKTTEFFCDKSKQASLEIEQLSARVVEAETRLKTEVARIKKKLQIQITELEMSLDVANKTNIDLQKTIKRQSLQLNELTAQYDEINRQLSITMDSLSVTQRKYQALTAECEEVRGNYESALRAKKSVELLYEEAHSRINELSTVNANLVSTRAKVEQELQAVAADYEEITKELRISDERYQRVQVELKHTVEHLHEESERVVKIEAIKKSLEIEVKNLSIRLEEVEANAIVGGKRIIGKLEARIHDIELELDEEKRRHAETIKILRKKERVVKEVMIQCEEDQKNISLLTEGLDKANQKIMLYKRQLTETEGMSQQSVTRVRRFQRELEAAEDRADTAESNLTLIRAKHRTFVTTSGVPGSQVYLVQESRTSEIN